MILSLVLLTGNPQNQIIWAWRMAQLLLHQRNGPLKRSLYSLSVPCAEELAPAIQIEYEHFALFLAWDAAKAKDQEICTFASKLFARGLAVICIWGNDCERVHDLFDRVELEEEWQLSAESVVISTWHENEPLEKALWFFVNCSYAHEEYAPTCSAGIAVTVGDAPRHQQISSFLSDLTLLEKANVA